jgi:phage terminase Nu1 subunit (DNA packaging protein)
VGPAFAKNFVDLADILGVTRQSITTWKKRKDAPTPAANGLHDVAAWREFMKQHDLKGGTPTTDLETALRARKLLAEVEERELKVAVRKGLYVAMEEVRQEWTRIAGRVTSLLRNKFENELPPILSGLDATGIQEENRKAIDEVLTLLNQGHG